MFFCTRYTVVSHWWMLFLVDVLVCDALLRSKHFRTLSESKSKICKLRLGIAVLYPVRIVANEEQKIRLI